MMKSKDIKRNISWLIRNSSLVLILSILSYGCTTYRPSPSTTYPVQPPDRPEGEAEMMTAVYSPTLGAAAVLYRQAESSFTKGSYRQAEMEIERAVRIEPRNVDYWHTLGKVMYQQRLYEQAVQICLKSKSLAGSNRQLLQMNDELIDRARQLQSP